ncbi:MAG: branched-chain amino acid aminotransferase [Frankiaceae bacterium]|nr:branched-chain amino acid aminotransferase [Frankiaceae bacterium]
MPSQQASSDYGAAVVTWVNGELVADDEATVSAYDHGFVVGDGVFETLKVIDGEPFALRRHLDRLARSGRGLGLAVDVDQVRSAVRETLGAVEGDRLRLRITLTGGPGPLGSERGSAGPTLVVATAPMPTWGATAAVVFSPWPRNERSPLTGLKTTSYAENVLALQDAKHRGASEAIFANTVGSLCEGTGSNLFLEWEGRLVTPPMGSGCLAGVTRALLLEWVPEVEELDLPAHALRGTSEAFLASSTRDVQPIASVDGEPLPLAPGPLTARAAEVFAERSAAEVDP